MAYRVARLDETLSESTSPTSFVTDPNRRRILLVGPDFHFLGGLSVYTCRLANALAESHSVSILRLRKLIPRRLYPGGDRVGKITSTLHYSPAVRDAGSIDWYLGADVMRIDRMLRRQRPDAIVLQWWTAATLHTYLAITRIARRHRIPVIMEFHELQDTGEAAVPLVGQYNRTLLPRLVSRLDGAILHNQHDLELLISSLGSDALDGVRIAVAPHGPYDHLAPAPIISDDEARAESENEPETQNGTETEDTRPTRILFFGLIRPYKGLEDLIEAFNGMSPEDAKTFELTVVGETWEGWDRPAEAIAESPYRDRITFENRYVPDTEIPAFFADADVVVLPYRRGSSSGPLHIAMSGGLHVVLYAVGGLTEAVADYDGATLVPPNDVVALREALLQVRTRRDERFSDPHSWNALTDALAALLPTD